MSEVTVVEQNNAIVVSGSAAPITVVAAETALTVQQDTYSITVASPGSQGINGTQGGSFTFTQTSPASSWTVVHGLGRYPNISYIDDLGFVWLGDVEHLDLNTAVLVFPSPRTGKAVCS